MTTAFAINRTFHKIPSTVTSPPHPAIAIENSTNHYRSFPFRASIHAVIRNRRFPQLAARADDSSAPLEMTAENALRLLGLREGASFDEILGARNAILFSCKDDLEAITQVEAAYDMLLMESLNQRRSGKVANCNIRYADVKPVRSPGTTAVPQWLKSAATDAPFSINYLAADSLGIQAGIYGALMAFTFVSGASTNLSGEYNGADVPGLILATSFGASIYFLRKKSINFGKATLMTAGCLVVGAIVGSAVENWLQVYTVPFFGANSSAIIISEFVLFSQLLVSLYLR